MKTNICELLIKDKKAVQYAYYFCVLTRIMILINIKI